MLPSLFAVSTSDWGGMPSVWLIAPRPPPMRRPFAIPICLRLVLLATCRMRRERHRAPWRRPAHQRRTRLIAPCDCVTPINSSLPQDRRWARIPAAGVCRPLTADAWHPWDSGDFRHGDPGAVRPAVLRPRHTCRTGQIHRRWAAGTLGSPLPSSHPRRVPLVSSGRSYVDGLRSVCESIGRRTCHWGQFRWTFPGCSCRVPRRWSRERVIRNANRVGGA
jgi:hypothetical protein